MCSDNVKYVCAAVGQGAFAVEARAQRLGADLVVAVGGGSAHHVGAVSLAVYEPERDSATVSTICVHTHRDDAVSAHFAKAISREMKCTVTVSAGLHVDNAGEKEINELWSNSLECCDRLIEMLKSAMEEV